MTDRDISLREGDAATIGEVMRVMDAAFDPAFGEAWTAAQCLGILGLPGVWLSLAYDRDRLVGFALSRIVLDEAELLLLGVDPVRRRRGIGRRLVDRTLVVARATGAVRLHLEVRDGNTAAVLYAGAGFVEVGRRKNYYRGRDARLFDAISLSYSFIRE